MRMGLHPKLEFHLFGGLDQALWAVAAQIKLHGALAEG
jgi:hypothetical protein